MKKAGLYFNDLYVGESVRYSVKPERIFTRSPHIGVVVGTFASLPYVHLQLEARKRFYPLIPLLVHDDHSPQRDSLSRLCAEYGAMFESNNYQMPDSLGDMTAFLGGMLWAPSVNVDLLVKLSRRFIPLRDWVQDLTRLALDSQGATYSHSCTSFGMGFRTECMGLHVETWKRLGPLEDIRKKILAHDSQFVEGYMHGLAGSVSGTTCLAHNMWEDSFKRPPSERGFVPWDFMGKGRLEPNENVLWHDRDDHARYHDLGVSWGLPYSLKQYQHPNNF